MLPSGSALARIWFSTGRYPSGFARFRYFGPTASRFDHHLPGPGGRGQSGPRGILYAVYADGDRLAFATALAEVFQETRTVELSHEGPRIAVFRTLRDLPLLDLTGHWTTRIGAHAGLSSGPREITREWSRDFYAAYPDIEGIRYRSSMSGGRSIAVALYERSLSAIPSAPFSDRPLGDRTTRRTLIQVAALLGYQVVP